MLNRNIPECNESSTLPTFYYKVIDGTEEMSNHLGAPVALVEDPIQFQAPISDCLQVPVILIQRVMQTPPLYNVNMYVHRSLS